MTWGAGNKTPAQNDNSSQIGISKMNTSKTFVTKCGMEIYINFSSDYACFGPIDSKRDSVIVPNFSKLFNLNELVLSSFCGLTDALKEQLFLMVTDEETNKATLNEQIATVQKMVKMFYRSKEVQLFSKYY